MTETLSVVIEEGTKVCFTDEVNVDIEGFYRSLAEIVASRFSLSVVGKKAFLYLLGLGIMEARPLVVDFDDMKKSLGYKSHVSCWQGLSHLAKHGIVKRQGKGIYWINPVYIAKQKIEVRKIIQVSDNG